MTSNSFDNTTIKFSESFVSGTDYGNILKMIFSGARNCLTVSVNDSEVYIRAVFPFNLFTGWKYHIPKSQIISAERGIHSFLRDSVLLTFYDSKGNQKKLELYIVQSNKFISLLNLANTNAT